MWFLWGILFLMGSCWGRDMPSAHPATSVIAFGEAGEKTTVEVHGSIKVHVSFKKIVQEMKELCDSIETQKKTHVSETESGIPLLNINHLQLELCRETEESLRNSLLAFTNRKLSKLSPGLKFIDNRKSKKKRKRDTDEEDKPEDLSNLQPESLVGSAAMFARTLRTVLPRARPVIGRPILHQVPVRMPSPSTPRHYHTRYQQNVPRRSHGRVPTRNHVKQPRRNGNPHRRRPYPPPTTTAAPEYYSEYDYQEDYSDSDYSDYEEEIEPEQPELKKKVVTVNPLLPPAVNVANVAYEYLSALIGRKKRSTDLQKGYQQHNVQKNKQRQDRYVRGRSPSRSSLKARAPLTGEAPGAAARAKTAIQKAATRAKNSASSAFRKAQQTGSAVAQATGLKAFKRQRKGGQRLQKRSTQEVSSLSRPKRFLGALVSGAVMGLVGIVTGTLGFGGVARQAELQRLASVSRKHFLAEDRELSALGASLNETMEALTETEHIAHYILIYLQQTQHIQHYINHVQDLAQGLHLLMQNKVDPVFVNLEELSKELDSIYSSMNKIGAKPVFEHPSEILSFDVNVIFNTTSLAFDIHMQVPGEYLHSRQKLKRWIPLPIHSHSNDHSLYLMPEVTSVLLSVNPEAPDHMQASPVTAEELTSCHKYKHLYLCPPERAEYVSKEADCLTSLYAASLRPNEHDVKDICPFKKVQKLDIAVRMSHRIFRLFLATSQVLTGRCERGSVSLGSWEGLLEVEIPEGCHVTTRHFNLHPDEEVGKSLPQLETHEVSLAIHNDSSESLHRIYKELVPAPSILTFDQAEDWINLDDSSLRTTKPWVQAALALGTLLGSLVLIWAVLRCCGVDPVTLLKACGTFFKVMCRSAKETPKDPNSPSASEMNNLRPSAPPASSANIAL